MPTGTGVTTFVYYQGRLIEKRYRPAEYRAQSELPAPSVLSFEGFASPVDDRWISSRRQHDQDLYRTDSYDPRDTPITWKRAQDERYKRQCAASEP